ncbi:MAG TPA: hypothetical protein VI997_11250 [Candidatus Thermoplasmatota archaeon]|nr:hypothetical protein [Candidatus Thermoplasmatota archaeon]
MHEILHVLPGDADLPAFEASVLPGEGVAWREALVDGPPPGPTRTAWIRERWHFTPHDDAEKQREALLAHLPYEAVLWFGGDLFCGLNALYVLAGLAAPRVVLARPEPDCAALKDPSAWTRLFEARTALPLDGLVAARRAWDAVAAGDPSAAEQLLEGPLPEAVAATLRGHLARLPDARTGLDPAEGALLRTLASGPRAEREILLLAFLDPAVARMGLGDLQLLERLRGLVPLTEPAGSRLALSPLGRRVLDGKADRVTEIGIDRWTGGIHLAGRGPVWRFDATASAAVLR